MDLHRSGSKPDWEYVPAASRNGWQRLAARTGGVATPSNLLTVLGLLLTAVGLFSIATDRMVIGVVGLAAGGLADLADGWVAAKTGTKSPLGKALDAVADKLALGATLVVLTFIGIIPLVITGIVVLQSIASAGAGLVAKIRKKTVQVSLAGKRTVLLQRLTVGMFALAALNKPYTSFGMALFEAGGYVLAGASLPFALRAIRGYVQAAVSK